MLAEHIRIVGLSEAVPCIGPEVHVVVISFLDPLVCTMVLFERIVADQERWQTAAARQAHL